jgi:dihydroxyacetone kinase-like protein
MALVSNVGGAAGPLYGTLFLQLATGMGSTDEVDLPTYAEAWRGALRGVQNRGKAQPGDKTMIDALTPAVDALEQAQDLGQGLRDAAAAAEEGMRATIPLVARKGRASYLGERSAGHQDPGATSTYYLFKSAAEALGS